MQMVNRYITNYQENVNQSHNEISPHTYLNGCHKKINKWQMLARIWRKRNPCTWLLRFGSVQLLSRVWLFATTWTSAHLASLSITNSQSLPKPLSIESVMQYNHLILCHPLLLLPSIFPRIRVLSNESALRMRWPKYRSFSFNISPSNEHPGLISFRMDWLDLLAAQGTLESPLQHHSSKASILLCSAFFIVQLSHPYMTNGKPEPWLDGHLLTK